MPLINASGFVADPWTRLADHAPIPAVGDVILPLARWLEEAPARSGRTGLEIPNHRRAEEIAPHFSAAALLSIDFPSFADGRGFSLARRMRALGYGGVLRACGPVIADQLAYLQACGFDEAEIPDSVAARQPEAQWIAAAASMNSAYQRGYAGPANILEARRAKR